MRHAAIALVAMVALGLAARTADAQGLSPLAANATVQWTSHGGWGGPGHGYHHGPPGHHGYPHGGYPHGHSIHRYWHPGHYRLAPPVFVYPHVYRYPACYAPHGVFQYYGPRLGISIGF